MGQQPLSLGGVDRTLMFQNAIFCTILLNAVPRLSKSSQSARAGVRYLSINP